MRPNDRRLPRVSLNDLANLDLQRVRRTDRDPGHLRSFPILEEHEVTPNMLTMFGVVDCTIFHQLPGETKMQPNIPLARFWERRANRYTEMFMRWFDRSLVVASLDPAVRQRIYDAFYLRRMRMFHRALYWHTGGAVNLN